MAYYGRYRRFVAAYYEDNLSDICYLLKDGFVHFSDTQATDSLASAPIRSVKLAHGTQGKLDIAPLNYVSLDLLRRHQLSFPSPSTAMPSYDFRISAFKGNVFGIRSRFGIRKRLIRCLRIKRRWR